MTVAVNGPDGAAGRRCRRRDRRRRRSGAVADRLRARRPARRLLHRRTPNVNRSTCVRRILLTPIRSGRRKRRWRRRPDLERPTLAGGDEAAAEEPAAEEAAADLDRGGAPRRTGRRSTCARTSTRSPCSPRASRPTPTARVTVDVPLPDNLTRYRVMAVAVDGVDRFGTGESTITARLPLQVRPSAPRFLNFGDRFELPVVVQNQTDDADRGRRRGRRSPTSSSPAPPVAGSRCPPTTGSRCASRRWPTKVGTARFRVAAVSGDVRRRGRRSTSPSTRRPRPRRSPPTA